jgi:hypothetical protein
VTSNVAPRLCAEMHRLWRDGQVDAAMAIQDRPRAAARRAVLRNLAGPVKHAAALLGHGTAHCRCRWRPLRRRRRGGWKPRCGMPVCSTDGRTPQEDPDQPRHRGAEPPRPFDYKIGTTIEAGMVLLGPR